MKFPTCFRCAFKPRIAEEEHIGIATTNRAHKIAKPLARTFGWRQTADDKWRCRACASKCPKDLLMHCDGLRDASLESGYNRWRDRYVTDVTYLLNELLDTQRTLDRFRAHQTGCEDRP